MSRANRPLSQSYQASTVTLTIIDPNTALIVIDLQQGIVATKRQVEHFGLNSPQVFSRLAELYAGTLSTLRPRVMVTGNPQWLQQPALVERVRASLLAAVRSAVLWRQIGGRQWQLLLHRRQSSMLARGLLTGTTLDNR